MIPWRSYNPIRETTVEPSALSSLFSSAPPAEPDARSWSTWLREAFKAVLAAVSASIDWSARAERATGSGGAKVPCAWQADVGGGSEARGLDARGLGVVWCGVWRVVCVMCGVWCVMCDV